MRYNEVYLDNLSSSPTPDEVIEKMGEYFTKHYGNPVCYHQFGRWSKSAYEYFQEKVAEILDVRDTDISFTIGFKIPKIGDGKILISPFEPPEIFRYLKKSGRKMEKISISNWEYDLDWLENKLSNDKIALVVLSSADRVTGTVQPIEQCVEICHKYGTSVLVNFSTFIGRRKFSISNIGTSFGYIQGRVFGAPCDLILGEKIDKSFPHQLAGGFVKSLELLYENLDSHISKLDELSQYFWEMIQLHLPHLKLLGGDEKIAGNFAIAFEDVQRQALMLALDMQGVMVWAGDNLYEPIESLLKSGVPKEIEESTVRFSLWRQTTQEDLDYVLRVLPPLVDRVRYEMGSPKFKK